MPETKQMTWKAAILKVLEGASKPLHYQEGVLAEIAKQGLRTAEEKNASLEPRRRRTRGQAVKRVLCPRVLGK